MEADRRREGGRDESEFRPRLSLVYAVAGAFLGLGSPLGALLARAWLAGPRRPPDWLRGELRSDAFLYGYMAVGTVFAFAAFGYFLGRRGDRQRARNAVLQRRVEQLRLDSITDGLTGAYSHAYILETLQLELANARRSGRPVSILMLDLDDFKRVNDTYGHLFGDLVLRTVAETIEAGVREADIVGRFGGEEFLVVMPGADPGTSFAVAERVRVAIGALEIADGEGRASPRVSIGAATAEDSDDATRLVARADERLYAAKRQGKNRTVPG